MAHARTNCLLIAATLAAASGTAAGQPAGTLVGWGYNSHGQRTIPDALQGVLVKAVATGYQHSLVIKVDGTLYAWGGDEQHGSPGVIPEGVQVPGRTFKAIAAGYHHCVALDTEGKVYAWGGISGESTFPSYFEGMRFSAIAAGEYWSVAIATDPVNGYVDGSLYTWGPNASNCGDTCTNCQGVTVSGYDPTYIPPALWDSGPFKAVSASGHYGIAQRVDNSLIAWGADEQSMCQVTNLISGPVDVFSAGHRHAIVLRFNHPSGEIAFWGHNGYAQSQTAVYPAACPPFCTGTGCVSACYKAPPEPFPAVIDVKGGYYHSTGQRLNGSLFGWGKNLRSQCNVPAGSFITWSSSYDHGLAIEVPPRHR